MEGMTDFMKITAKTDLMQEVAKLHGVDREEVCCGIREAVEAARMTGSDGAQAFWKALPEDTAETEVVLEIVKLLFAE